MSTHRPSGQQFESLRDRVLTTGNEIEIAGHIRGMRDLERVQSWVSFENRNQQRTWVLKLLGAQADQIRRMGVDDAE